MNPLLPLLVTANLALSSAISGSARSAGAAPAGAESVADRAIARAHLALEAIAAVPLEERRFETTIGALDDLLAELYSSTLWTSFLSNVHPNVEVRRVGEETRRAVSDFAVEIYLHEGAYRTIRAWAETEPELEGERARLLEETLREYRRAGMELAAEPREGLKQIEFQLNEMGQEFSKNLRDDESFLPFTRAELAGVPESFLEALPRSGDLYLVPLKGPQVTPIFDDCEVPLTRQKLSIAYGRRGGERNVALLEKLISLRHEKATLLGYRDNASYQTEVRMALSPDKVMAFYEELRPKLRRKAEQDYEELLGAKREATGDPEARLDSWDTSFYKNYLLETRYAVDHNRVREYFPLDAVYSGLFEITQELFGLEYRDVTERAAESDRETWHPDVRLYEVWDRASGQKLGEFFTDLFPRPNKYGHAAQFPIVLRKRQPDGSLQLPVVALVCNFTQPTESRPSLLSHREVETFFHEFGHCLHSLLTEAELASFAGTQVARDFVEAPSQMLENWVWDAGVLKTFTRHYETGEPLPDDLLEGMLAARNLRSGIDAEFQAYLGVMDMRFHTDPDGIVDTTAVCFDTKRELSLFPATEGTFPQASFGHMVGYDAGYYGYLWSLVYAQDMFGRFKDLGLLDPEAGAYYREKILSKGGTVDAIDLVRDYLGREPSPDAFLEHLGLTSDA